MFFDICFIPAKQQQYKTTHAMVWMLHADNYGTLGSLGESM